MQISRKNEAVGADLLEKGELEKFIYQAEGRCVFLKGGLRKTNCLAERTATRPKAILKENHRQIARQER